MKFSKRLSIDGAKKAVNIFKDYNAVIIYLVAMIVSSLVYMLYLISNNGEASTDIFFKGITSGDDIFMDFYNSIRDASNTEITYTVRHVIYPPMANLIFLFCSLFVRDGYTSTEFGERKLWSSYPEAVMINFVFLGLALLIIFCLVRSRCDSIKGSNLIAIFAVLNAPFIFAIERSNIVLYAIIGLALYVFFYNSKNKFLREISLLGLAFAFSIKAYPVIFGWWLIADSRYKDAARCALYGILMFLIPSFFFGGPSCILTMIENMSTFSPLSSDTFFEMLLGDSGSIVTNAAMIIGVVCFVLLPLVSKNGFRLTALGMSIIVLYPSFSIFYSWAFMIIPLFIAISQKRVKGIDWFYFIPLIIPFMLIPGMLNSDYRALANAAATAIILAAATELVIFAVKKINAAVKKHRTKTFAV